MPLYLTFEKGIVETTGNNMKNGENRTGSVSTICITRKFHAQHSMNLWPESLEHHSEISALICCLCIFLSREGNRSIYKRFLKLVAWIMRQKETAASQKRCEGILISAIIEC